MKTPALSLTPRLRIVFGLGLACALAQNVHAASTLPFYESFPASYGENEYLGAAGSSGVTWDFGNSTSSSSSRILDAAALSYPGLDITNGSKGLRSNGFGKSRGASFTPQTNVTLYASFLLNIQTNAIVPGNKPIFALSPSTTGSGSVNAAGAAVFVDDQGRLMVSKNNATAPAAPMTYALAPSNTYLVVLRYQYNSAGSSDDEVALWLNPTSLGDNANVPPSTIATTNGSDVQAFRSVAYVAPSAPSLTNLFFMDEIRVGAAWDQVTPPACSPGATFNVTGGGSVCAGAGFPVGLSGSQTGVDYWLFTNGVFTGTTASGNGAALTFGTQTANAVYTVLASNITTTCVGWMKDSATVAILASPSVVTQPADVSVVSGALAAFSVSATGDGLTYQWRRNGVNLTDGGNISGAASPNLVIYPAGAGDVASAANGYDVVINGSCTPAATSSRAGLALKTAASNLSWVGDGLSNPWDIGITADWSQGGSPAAFNNGDKVTFDDTAYYFNVNLADGFLNPSSITVNAWSDYVFGGNGSITGPTTSLLKDTYGALTMNFSNSYGGGTIISNGTVKIAGAAALGTGPVTLAGGTLNVASAIAGYISNAITVVANSTFSGVKSEPYFAGPFSGTDGTLTISGSSANFTPRFYANFTFNRPIITDGYTILRLYADNTGQQVFNGVISGAGRVERRSQGSAGVSVFNAANTYSGGTLLRGGGIGFGIDSVASLPPTIDSGPIGTGSLYLDDTGGDTSRNLSASGGPRIVGNPIIALGGATNNTTVNLSIVGSYDLNLSGDVTLGTDTLVVRVDNTGLSTFSGVISGTGGLTKTGTNTLILSATNTYTGPTTVSAGTLFVNGQIDAGSVTVSGGALCGSGTILGDVTIQSGGTLAPGNSGLGTLTINNTLTLQAGSTTSVEINKTAGASDLVSGLASVTYGGTLAVNNAGGALTTNDVFKLFDATSYSGLFSSVAPPPGAGLAWNTTTLAIDGKLRIAAAAGPNPGRTNVSFVVSGNNLTLSWPADHTGWTLQAQTNALGAGLNTNWVTVPGSTGTNQVTMPISSANGSVFYRLALPQ